MKARYRCKQHHQGDKCRLELSHSGDRVGQFSEWNKQGVVRSTRMASKRNRHANKIVRGFSKHEANIMDSKDRKFAIEILGKALQWLRG